MDENVDTSEREQIADLDSNGGFWSSNRNLQAIWDQSIANGLSPSNVLMVALVRITACIPPTYVLDHRLGQTRSLNLFHATVARSGRGKTAGESLAEKLIQLPARSFHGANPTSTEGLVSCFLESRTSKPENGGPVNRSIRMTHSNILVKIDELGSRLGGIQKWHGQTVMSALDSVWVGAGLYRGDSADPATREMRLPRDSYRMCVEGGTQPKNAGTIFEQTDGFLQRCLFSFASVHDACPELADKAAQLMDEEVETNRDGINPINLTGSFGKHPDDPNALYQRAVAEGGMPEDSLNEIEFPSTAIHDSKEFRKSNLAYGRVPENESHDLVQQEKIAVPLNILLGKGLKQVTNEAWDDARLVLSESRRVRQLAEEQYEACQRSEQAKRQSDKMAIHDDIDLATKKLVSYILHYQGGEVISGRDLNIRYKKRWKDGPKFLPVLRHAESKGYIAVTGNDGDAPQTQWRIRATNAGRGYCDAR